MNNEKAIKVGIIYNAFDPTKIEEAELVYRKNTKLKNYLRDLPTDCEWKIGLNGKPVTLEENGDIRLKATDNLTLVVVPRGGDAKDILRMVALVAVVVGGAFLFGPASIGGLALAGPGIAGIAAMTAFVVAGSLLVNAVLPTKVPKLESDSETSSYGYDGAKNTVKQGVALPVVYGKYRVAGNYVDLFTENVGDDQYMYGRTVLSDGKVAAITDPYLNDQPINNYTGVDFGVSLGANDATVNPWFNRNIAQVNKGIKISGNGTPVIHTTQDVVDAVSLNLQFTRGLVHLDKDSGKKQNRSVSINVEISPSGQGNWQSINAKELRWLPGDPLLVPTPLTDKLAVTVAPIFTSSGINASYDYIIEYKRSTDTTWTLFKSVNGQGSNSYSLNKTSDYDTIGDGTATYSSFASNQTFEWSVPEGQYNVRVRNNGTLVAHGCNVPVGRTQTFTFTDNRAKAIRKTVEIGSLPTGVYDVRITRTTPDSTDEYDVDELYLVDVGEITTTPIAMTNIANAYYRIKMSEQLSSVPTISWLVQGVEMNQYNDAGEVTTKAWSDNPAWIVLDMLIGEDRGTPGLYNIDFPKFVEWANWCETTGLKFNGVFDTTQSLWDACVDVLKVGHAAFSRIGTKLSLAIDKPDTPVMMFGPGNIYKDTFKITYLAMTGRANEYELSYYDKDDLNKQKTLRIVDPTADQRGEIPRPVQYSLVGIDNYAQAQKEVWYQLYNNRYMRRTVTFDAPIESIGLSIGDIALIQHDMMDWGTSGRLKAGSSLTTVNFDRPVQMEEGNAYSVLVIHDKLVRGNGIFDSATPTMVVIREVDNLGLNLSNVKRVYQPGTGKDVPVLGISFVGSTAYITTEHTSGFNGGLVQFIDTDVIEERDVVYNANETTSVTVTSGFSLAPQELSNFMFGIKTIVKKPYRLKAISGTGFDRRTLTFVEYNPAIYNPPEYIVPQPPTSGPKVVRHVTELTYVYDPRSTDINTVINGVLSWNSRNVFNYGGADVYVSLNGSDFIFNKTVLGASECQLTFHYGDEVVIKVVAFNTAQTRAPIATAPTVAQTLTVGPPLLQPVQGLAVTLVSYLALGLVQATWTAPTGLQGGEVYRVQVKKSTSTSWDEYGVTTETFLRIGDLYDGLYTIRVRTERGPAYSTWAQTTFTVGTTAETITPGATKNEPKGEWQSDVDYQKGDIVTYEGSGYIAYLDPPLGALPTNTNYWRLLVQKGADGPPGEDGVPGPPGPPGEDGVGVNIYINRKAVQLRGYANGVVISYADANGQLSVLKGSTDLMDSATLTVEQVNCSGTINTAYGVPVANKPKGYYQVTNVVDDNTAALIIHVQVGTVVFTETFSIGVLRGGYEIVNALPTDNNFVGRIVFLTTNGKLYRYTTTGWTASVPTVDLTGTVASSQMGIGVGGNQLIGAVPGTNPRNYMRFAYNPDGVQYYDVVAGGVTTGGQGVLQSLNFGFDPGGDYSLPDGSTFMIYQPNPQTGASGFSDIRMARMKNQNGDLDEMWPIEEGKTYEFSLWACTYGCRAAVLIVWFDGNGNAISETPTGDPVANSYALLQPDEVNGRTTLDGYKRIYNRGKAPVGARQAMLVFRKAHTSPNATNTSRLFGARPMFAETTPYATEMLPYSVPPYGFFMAENIVAQSITANQLAANSVTADKVSAGAITAGKISVTQLSAITATIGILRTATSGLRTEIDNNGMRTYNASNVLVYQNGIY